MLECVRLTEHIRQLRGNGDYCSTLVTGRDRALLFDTMDGTENLFDYVREITALPLIVINSHGHFDHTGGNGQFGEIYINRLELPILKRYSLIFQKLEMEGKTSQRQDASRRPYRAIDINAGDIFDLGGVTLEAAVLPGHTPGSVGLLCREEKILLAGDAFTPMMCLFFPESLALDAYIATLDYAEGLDFNYFILGHYCKLFPKRLLGSLKKCAELPYGNNKGRDFIYTLIPEYRGKLYFSEMYNEDADGIVCIITKPDSH